MNKNHHDCGRCQVEGVCCSVSINKYFFIFYYCYNKKEGLLLRNKWGENKKGFLEKMSDFCFPQNCMNSVLKKRSPRKRAKTKAPPGVRLVCFEKNLRIGQENKSAPWNWATDNNNVNVGQWSEYWQYWKKNHPSSEKYTFRHLVSKHPVPLSVTLAADLLHWLIDKEKGREGEGRGQEGRGGGEEKGKKKEKNIFIISKLSTCRAHTAIPGRWHQHLVLSLMHPQWLTANCIISPSPWDEEQREGGRLS